MALADRIMAWIREQVERAGADGVVLGLSGGVDSATVLGLSIKALGVEHVRGLILPVHSLPQDSADAELAANAFGLEPVTIDLTSAYDALVAALPSGTDLANANLKPRLRMIAVYQVAGSEGKLVIGTGNKTELLVGYFTKYGDGGVDLMPLAGLYKHQVWGLAAEIGVPKPLIEKPPSAGLWPGQTDEEEMGISYPDLDATLEAIERGDTGGLPAERVERVRSMMAQSEHKRRLPPIFDPERENGR
ncbi:MAG TPA: NAD+ synthase [Thermomicrobiaceae bacterium]|nr:NAD+ synthase [Thermomicrobiaceae bacterium]